MLPRPLIYPFFGFSSQQSFLEARIKYYATYNRRLPASAGRLRITQI